MEKNLISRLGLGTVKFGRNRGVKYPGGEGFALPSDADISSLLDLCLDLGITLLDTAPAYGSAEERLGGILGARREKFFLMTKTGEEFSDGKSTHNFTAAHTIFSVERSLKRLKTDCLDCALVHSSPDDINILKNTDALETLVRLKEAGKIRMVGVSTYTVEGGIYAAEKTDAVMVAYNNGYTAEKEVIDRARLAGKAVFVKKGLGSGHTDDPARDIRFVLETPGVSSLIIGSINPRHIRENAAGLRA